MLLSLPKVSGLYSTERQRHVTSCSQTSSRWHDAGVAAMSSETFSLIVSCWHNELASATRLKVVQVDNGEEVHLSDGSFLLRISRDENASVERCFIRHIASGWEAYVQGGPNLRAFVNACLLNNGTPGPFTTNTLESE